MRALIVRRPDQLELGKISEPEIGPCEALVKIKGCGICSTTDWELIHGRQPYHNEYPAVLGHEAVGEVIETGGQVESFRKGDLVTRPVAIWPGEKRDGLASAWGGFAEYGIVRDRAAMARAGNATIAHDYTAQRQVVLPSGLALSDAILSISLSETASWFRQLPPVAGKSICIAGTGVAGLSMIRWSLMAGAEKIVVLGRRNERLDLARRLGATGGINVTTEPVAVRLREETGGRGVDVFIEAVGRRDQVQVGLSLLAPGGLVAIYGAPEKTSYDVLNWSAGPGPASIAQFSAEEHLASGWVTKLIALGLLPTRELMTHPWPLDNYREAFDAVAAGTVVKGWIEL